ncbi:P-loop NTPase [Roseococcus sp. DSY-14]|uniref:P-loop NTPase n=1 Tax=Roseococcus sp. DSY-14 TaxID=3369650 RepID=UPI00387B8684
MSGSSTQRSLAERAVEALGGAAVLGQAPRPAAPAGEAAAAPPPPGAPPASPSAAPSAAPAAARPARPAITRQAMIGAGAHSLEAHRSRCSEELAVVQNQVVRTLRSAPPAGAGRHPGIVVVTSARPGEGKSFMSLNLAIAIARAGTLPALLVDADSKPGNLSELLGASTLPGLRTLAAQPSLAPLNFVAPTEVERLHLLPYGAAPTDPAAAHPSGNALAGALLRLAEAFPKHALIVDTPPVLSTSEASALASVAGQVLIVVQAETTQRPEVEAALDMLDACPTLQLVLNQARISTPDSFGAYGYEAYGHDKRD